MPPPAAAAARPPAPLALLLHHASAPSHAYYCLQLSPLPVLRYFGLVRLRLDWYLQPAHLCPASTAISRPGTRTSHSFMDLSTLPVASRQSLYLHQSAAST